MAFLMVRRSTPSDATLLYMGPDNVTPATQGLVKLHHGLAPA